MSQIMSYFLDYAYAYFMREIVVTMYTYHVDVNVFQKGVKTTVPLFRFYIIMMKLKLSVSVII